MFALHYDKFLWGKTVALVVQCTMVNFKRQGGNLNGNSAPRFLGCLDSNTAL